MDTRIHLAYLRRIEETMKIRARRFKLAASVDNNLDYGKLRRIRNRHFACLTRERVHGVVL